MLKMLFSVAKTYLIVKAVDTVKDAIVKAGSRQPRRLAGPSRSIAKAAAKPASRSKPVVKRSRAKAKKAA
jgi:hypothetical protein